MKKYLALIYLSVSVMSLAQFKDNVFDSEQSKTEQNTQDIETQKQSANTFDSNVEQSPNDTTQSLGPGNPGEPVPIDGYLPLLLISSLGLVFYYQRKNKKVNI
ncbi:hypothetical protein [Epilithonimonas caeni]|uniref:hypothetical protein n=1 Tax=Epilithonimonas caeni TaxID=365343 RepID=UPI00047F0AAF|nr:hypothetical protein [Epilithonimonas caeni]